MKTDWKAFQDLVALIEATAAPAGATVKTPDMIPDIVTRHLREVDASIRYRVGMTDVLITVECHDHSRKDVITWIEELVTKQSSIGAAKTIAVSSKGFSKAAQAKAKQHSIELRTLSKVSHADITSWFLPGGAVHVFRLIEDVRCKVYFRQEDGTSDPVPFTVADSMEPIFHNRHIPSPFPVYVLFESMEMWDPKIFHQTPLDGTKVPYEIPFKGGITIDTKHGKRHVHHGTVSGIISYQSAVCTLASGTHHRYVSQSGELAQHTTFEAKLMGLPFQFNHQATKNGQYVSYRVQKKPKKRNP